MSNNKIPPLPQDLPPLPDAFPVLRDDINESIMDKKGAGEASTELSKFRTRMSEYRTGMSEHRTQLSDHRTELSEHRTDLSDLRTHLSNERTHLSQVRTAVSLMSFGVTLNRFSVYLQENNRTPDPTSAISALRDIESVGAGMVVLGTLVLLWAGYRYYEVDKQIKTGEIRSPKVMILFLTICIIFLGAISSAWLIFG